ncbi:MAG: ABC transporter ATP-binding protein [Betaproteobacteria bacterium]|nr:ABC transporter ATP-binding protein [Betaproteobacteria bacterium]
MSGRDGGFVEINRLSKRFGAEAAVREMCLSVAQGEFVTLLGPSGCGKTTTLRCIAGLERPDEGDIRIDGKTVVCAGRRIYLDPEKRNIGMVFQSYAVWPHMTVFDNVAYGLRVRRVGGAELREQTMKALQLVGLAALAERYATKLSGGQRQRVALARAIAYRPNVILFDEPLSNLDAKLREQMRMELVRLQHEVGITSIYVTHDQAEALVMSDRVVVMNEGRIQQIADPHTIYTRPVNAFVAKFIGVANLLEGIVLGRSGESWELEIGLGAERAPLRLRADGDDGFAPGRSAVLCVRPEDIRLHTARPDDAAGHNIIEAEVVDTVYLGTFLECHVRVGPYELCVQTDHFKPLAPREKVFLAFQPDHGLCLAE